MEVSENSLSCERFDKNNRAMALEAGGTPFLDACFEEALNHP